MNYLLMLNTLNIQYQNSNKYPNKSNICCSPIYQSTVDHVIIMRSHDFVNMIMRLHDPNK